jgi:hypothetical protein
MSVPETAFLSMPEWLSENSNAKGYAEIKSKIGINNSGIKTGRV